MREVGPDISAALAPSPSRGATRVAVIKLLGDWDQLLSLLLPTSRCLSFGRKASLYSVLVPLVSAYVFSGHALVSAHVSRSRSKCVCSSLVASVSGLRCIIAGVSRQGAVAVPLR